MRAMSPAVPPLLLALMAAAGGAQERDLPPGAELKVIDVVFRIEDLAGDVVDLKVRETETEVRIELAADVLFDFDKATILPKADDTLTKAAALVREKAAGLVRIEGHTDAKGDDAYNQKLSERRAESVRQWFLRRGPSGLRLVASGFGETRPVAPNSRPDGTDDPEGRQKNRRVEIVIAKAGR
jgi:outer membrane protein OmpA-like peptidoglycan-associated protein